MLPGFRREPPDRPPEGEDWRPAAVLILLYPEAEGLRFPLIERGSSVGRHRGEMALPGGGLEPGESARAAALRETREELGLSPEAVAAIEVLGALTPLRVPPSGYAIAPFVGWLPSPPAFSPEPREVAALVPAPLGLLLDPDAREREERRFLGRPHEVPFFRLGERKVWGATAMILAEFAAVLEGCRIQ